MEFIELSKDPKTQRQLESIRLLSRLKEHFDTMPMEEMMEIYKEFPEFFKVVRNDNEIK